MANQSRNDRLNIYVNLINELYLPQVSQFTYSCPIDRGPQKDFRRHVWADRWPHKGGRYGWADR